MLKCFFFILVLFQTYSGLTQVVDSLKLQKKLNRIEDLSARNYDSTIILSSWVYNEAIKLNLQKIAWDASIYMADAYTELSKIDTAETILLNLLDQSISLNERIYQIRIYSKLAEIYADNSKFEESIENLITAERLLEPTDEFSLRFKIFNTLAITHRKMKDYSKAISILDSLWNNNYYQMDTIQRFYVVNNLGIVYANQSLYDKAIGYFTQAYEIIREVDNPENLSRIAYNLGAINYRLKRYDQSIDYLKKALPAYEKMNDKDGIENCYRTLAAIQLDLKNFDKAEQLSFQALGIAKEIGDRRKILGNYRNLYLIYSNRNKNSNDYHTQEKELDYFKKWAYLKDSLYQTEMTDKIFELEKQYETEKKNSQISLLEKDNRIKEDEIKLQQAQRNSLLIIVGIILFVLFTLAYSFNQNRKLTRLLKAQSKRIFAQNEKISKQNKSLQKAIETRDKLFSIVAHDLRSPLVSIANFSNLIKFYLKDKKYDSIDEVAQELNRKNIYVLELTDNLLSWARSQSETLMPVFEKVSIREIIEECLAVYNFVSEEKHIRLVFEEQEDVLLWADRNMVKTIVRNLINNAIKYTPDYGEVAVAYEKVDHFIEVMVSDSGIGMSEDQIQSLFDQNKKQLRSGTNGEKSTGLGLSVSNEFASVLNGKIVVECPDGKGCKFKLILPAYQKQEVISSKLLDDQPNYLN